MHGTLHAVVCALTAASLLWCSVSLGRLGPGPGGPRALVVRKKGNRPLIHVLASCLLGAGCLSVCVSVCLPARVSRPLSASPSANLSVCLPARVSRPLLLICLSTCLSVSAP